MKNKLSFQYFKSEVEGMEQEKDNAKLIVQDMKKQKIYDTEEITIMTMQNGEFRRKIKKLEDDIATTRDKRCRIQYDLDNVLEELFKTNESYKLYNKTLNELNKANQNEIDYIRNIKKTIKDLRKELQAEQNLRDPLHQHVVLQQKRINAMELQQEKEKSYLQSGLEKMNETIKNNTDLSLKVMKQLERNSKNLVAKQ